MKTNILLLFLSVSTSLLVIALGPRLPRVQGGPSAKRTLPAVRWIPPAAFRRTRVALLVISAALLYMALVPPGPAH
jgi:hypothetical protein